MGAEPNARSFIADTAIDRPRPPAPLAPWALGLAAGIALENAVPLNPIACAVVTVAAAVVLIRRSSRMSKTATIAVAILAAAGLGAARHHVAFRRVPADHVVHYSSPERQLARVRGTIASRPSIYRRGYEPFEPWLFDQDRTSLLLTAEAVETTSGWAPASGLVRVTVAGAALELREGDRVEAFGWLYRPSPPANPGQFEWATYNARQGVRVAMACDQPESVQPAADASGASARRLPQLRDYARRLLLDDRIETGDEHLSLFDAIILGRRSDIDRHIESLFVRTGCAHYLAVSGLHVGMMALTVWAILRALGFSRRVVVIVTLIEVAAYAMIAEPRPPILRAAIMTAAFCLAMLFRRPISPANSLSLAALLLLTIRPTALFDAGFQLSFQVVAAIVFLSPALSAMLSRAARALARRPRVSPEIEEAAQAITPRRTLVRAAGLRIWQAMCVTLTAWVSALPILAAHFGEVNLLGWLNSFVALPFVFAVVALGFVKLTAAAIWPALAGPLNAVLDLAMQALVAVMSWLADWAGAPTPLPHPPLYLTIAYYGVLIAAAAFHYRRRGRRALAASAGLLVAAVAAWQIVPNSDTSVRITQLAVGRGTSTVIELPGGKAWLYDAGASGAVDPGSGIILPYLRSRGVTRIEGIILSHANLDHFGGVPSLLDAMPCGPIYVPTGFERFCESGPGAALLDEIKKRGHPLEPIDSTARWTSGDATFQVLWPHADSPPHLEANDTSVVLRLGYADRSVLFTGDIDYPPQQWLIENEDLTADVLMLPHHGAVVGSTRGFLEAVAADWLVRSSFVRDADSPELAAIAGDTPLLNTAEVGAVIVRLGEAGVSAKGFRNDARSP